MQARGRGATDDAHMNAPSVWQSARGQAASKVQAWSGNGLDQIEIPAFLRKQAAGPGQGTVPADGSVPQEGPGACQRRGGMA
jgi:hypothetical protein